MAGFFCFEWRLLMCSEFDSGVGSAMHHGQCCQELEKFGIGHCSEYSGVVCDGVSVHPGKSFDQIGESALIETMTEPATIRPDFAGTVADRERVLTSSSKVFPSYLGCSSFQGGSWPSCGVLLGGWGQLELDPVPGIGWLCRCGGRWRSNGAGTGGMRGNATESGEESWDDEPTAWNPRRSRVAGWPSENRDRRRPVFMIVNFDENTHTAGGGQGPVR